MMFVFVCCVFLMCVCGLLCGVVECVMMMCVVLFEKVCVCDVLMMMYYEFGGLIGVFVIMVVLLLVCYFFVYVCNEDGCVEVSKFARGGAFSGFLKYMLLWSVDGVVVVYGWMVFMVVVYVVILG